MAMPAVIPSISIVPNAEVPPQPARPFPPPTFSPFTLQRRLLSDEDGGNAATHNVIVEAQSGRTWLLLRKIEDAIFGAVWSAVEVKIENEARYVEQHDANGRTRRVAVKVMPRTNINRVIRAGAENPMFEVAAWGIVSEPGHPHVLPLEAALRNDDVMCLLSPLVDPGEMFAWVKSYSDTFDEARTILIQMLFRQIMEGLKYTHSKGICHADMSLENALVDMQKRTAYIFDYGKSFLMPVVNINGQYRRCKSVADGRKAKASYCSPETCKDRPYDGVKVDVFAAGAMLFMMLTGTMPFIKASRADPRFNKLVYKGDVKEVISQSRVPPIGDQVLYDPTSYRPARMLHDIGIHPKLP